MRGGFFTKFATLAHSVASLNHDDASSLVEKLFSLGVIFLLLRIFFEHFLQTIRNASLVKFVTPFLIHKKFILQLDISFLSFQ